MTDIRTTVPPLPWKTTKATCCKCGKHDHKMKFRDGKWYCRDEEEANG